MGGLREKVDEGKQLERAASDEKKCSRKKSSLFESFNEARRGVEVNLISVAISSNRVLGTCFSMMAASSRWEFSANGV